ncbi:MAG: hypothetical protein JNK05_06505 [Myxococcales bacterium]|nr:hypothetical protein [Myxococcales bacterium]
MSGLGDRRSMPASRGSTGEHAASASSSGNRRRIHKGYVTRSTLRDTPFGIAAWSREDRKRELRVLGVLDAFRHHHVVEAEGPDTLYVSAMCPTPFGITASREQAGNENEPAAGTEGKVLDASHDFGGQTDSTVDNPVTYASGMSDAGNQTHFHDAALGVTITTTQAQFNNTTYPIAGIVAISTNKIPAERGSAIILAALGAVFTAMSIAVDAALYVIGFGLLLFAVGIAAAVAAKNQYVLQLATAGGQITAYASRDADVIARISLALKQAVAARR